jgi:hypothetical protein
MLRRSTERYGLCLPSVLCRYHHLTRSAAYCSRDSPGNCNRCFSRSGRRASDPTAVVRAALRCLFNPEVGVYLYHDDAVVSGVGLTLCEGHGSNGSGNFELRHQFTLLVVQSTKLRSKPCSRKWLSSARWLWAGLRSIPLLRRPRRVRFRKPQPLSRRLVALHNMSSTTTGHRAVVMFPDAMFRRAATTAAATMRRRGAITGDGTMGRPSYALRRGAIIATNYKQGRLRAPVLQEGRLSMNQTVLSWK